MKKDVPADPHDAIQQSRRRRLRELIAAPPYQGTLSALGRSLGYKDGVFVRQMRDGERAITEKTVAKIEALHPGWFADASVDALPVSETDWALLTAFRDMAEEDRESLLRQAMERADKFKRLTAEALRRAAGQADASTSEREPREPPKGARHFVRHPRAGKKSTD